jgi:transposase InsO family protein
VSETWVSFERVLELTGMRRRWLFKQVSAGMIASRPSSEIRRNGKPQRAYLLSSLPEAAQLRHAEQISKACTIVVTPDAILERPPAAKPAREHNTRGMVPAQLKGEFETRYRAIEPLVLFGRRRKGERAGRFEWQGAVMTTFGELLSYQSGKCGVSAQTISRWYKRYRDGGDPGLVRDLRADYKHSHFFEKHGAAAAFAQSKHVGEGLSVQMVWEALRRDWKDLGERGAAPGYNTVRRYLQRIPRVTKRLAAEGLEKTIAKETPFVVRQRPEPNKFWVADHRVHDVFVFNTLFPELGYGKAYRPWLTAIYDQGSEKLLGCIWAPTPSSRTINAAIRMGVAQAGFPENFYWDNGKDFIAVGERMLAPELASLIQRHGIGVTHALPKHPQSKPIEAFFTRFSKRFDPLWGAGYCGSKPQLCSEYCREAQKQHEKYLAGDCGETLFKSDADFITAALQFIEEYNEEPQKRLGDLSPNKYFDRGYPAASRQAVDRRTLDQLLWQRDERVVHAGGCVELNNIRYEPTDESFPALAAVPGNRVQIARDPYDLSTAVAFEIGTGNFIGELRMQQLVPMSPNGRLSVDGIKANARRRHALLRSARLYLSGLEAISRANNWKPECELLIERARGSRTGTDNMPMANAPGAARPARAARQLPASPFVSDAVDALLAAEKED